jgi:hypothetical protein
MRADARVQADAVEHFLDVRAELFREIGNHIGVGDLERKERIGGVLDEFGAVDRGGDPSRPRGGRAGRVVHGAMENLIEDGPIDFAELPFGRFIFDADDDAVRMEKIGDGSAFTEKFGIGGYREAGASVAAINGERALELLAGLRWDGAFFDDELIGLGRRGNQASDAVNRTEVGVAIRKGRSANAYENDVAGNSAGRIRGKTEAAGLPRFLDDKIQARFEDGELAGFEGLDFCSIVVRAKDLMTELGEARARDQANVSRANDRNSQDDPRT